MATDYDSPRKTDDELTEDSLQELQARRLDNSSSTIDIDPDDVAESLELPGADLSNEELSFRVIPRQADEFTCSRCFLVHHRSQLAEDRDGQAICRLPERAVPWWRAVHRFAGDHLSQPAELPGPVLRQHARGRRRLPTAVHRAQPRLRTARRGLHLRRLCRGPARGRLEYLQRR